MNVCSDTPGVVVCAHSFKDFRWRFLGTCIIRSISRFENLAKCGVELLNPARKAPNARRCGDDRADKMALDKVLLSFVLTTI